MKRLTYQQVRDTPQVFKDMHMKAQNFKPQYGEGGRCPSCTWVLHKRSYRCGLGSKYCGIGGFIVDNIMTCDKYLWEKYGNRPRRR